MDEIKKIMEEMKEERQKALNVDDWGVANILEFFINKLENTLND